MPVQREPGWDEIVRSKRQNAALRGENTALRARVAKLEEHCKHLAEQLDRAILNLGSRDLRIQELERSSWDGECCRKCRRSYALVWYAPDKLWAKVTGRTDGGGLLCPDCFDELAVENGISLKWSCHD